MIAKDPKQNFENYKQKHFYSRDPIFAYECISYHYSYLKTLYMTSTSITRNKLIIPPKSLKIVSKKNNHIRAIKVFNSLPKCNPNLKNLDISQNYNRIKVKKWIRFNIF